MTDYSNTPIDQVPEDERMSELSRRLTKRQETGEVVKQRKLGPGDFNYVNLELMARDKEPFDAYAVSIENDLWTMLDRMVDSGYTFNLKHDERNDTHIVTVTCMNEQLANYTGVMPSRSDSVKEALQIFFFKHFQICREEWPITNEKTGKKWG